MDLSTGETLDKIIREINSFSDDYKNFHLEGYWENIKRSNFPNQTIAGGLAETISDDQRIFDFLNRIFLGVIPTAYIIYCKTMLYDLECLYKTAKEHRSKNENSEEPIEIEKTFDYTAWDEKLMNNIITIGECADFFISKIQMSVDKRI